jgi:DNA repair ATPase RecN
MIEEETGEAKAILDNLEKHRYRKVAMDAAELILAELEYIGEKYTIDQEELDKIEKMILEQARTVERYHDNWQQVNSLLTQKITEFNRYKNSEVSE